MKGMIFNERLKWIDEPRGRYLYVDFSNLEDSEAFELLLDFQKTLEKEALGSVSFFADVSHINVSTNGLSNFRKVSKECQKYINRSALIGLSAFGKTLFPIYRSITKTKVAVFATKESSLDYIFSSN